VLVWAKIQFDWKQIPIKYRKRKKKIDENNGREKVPRKSEKMPKYMPNLLHSDRPTGKTDRKGQLLLAVGHVAEFAVGWGARVCWQRWAVGVVEELFVH
jgi:hypothetical protein